MTITEIATTLETIKSLKLLKQETDTEIERLSKLIKDEMTASDKTELIAGAFRATYKDVASNRVDTKRLKTELPDVYSAYLSKSTTKRFEVA